MTDDAVHVGDVFKIGDAVVEVTQPRVPCFKLGIKIRIEGSERRFLESLRVGFYFRVLEVSYLGQWPTPWWEDGVDKGPKTRAGFVATTSINRHDFNVSWNAELDRGGLVVGDIVEITIDAEAILGDS